jgi:hypothetical protein
MTICQLHRAEIALEGPPNAKFLFDDPHTSLRLEILFADDSDEWNESQSTTRTLRKQCIW